jgi:hypothetical protein
VRRRLRVAAIVALLGAISCAKPTTSSSTPPTERRAEPPPRSEPQLGIADPELAALPKGTPPPAPELPPPPVYSDTKVPERYDGGAWSIRGLRDDLDARVEEGEAGQEVEVLAWVQEIYVAPTCPERGKCPLAKQPHLWVTDEQDERGKKHAMLVVNYAFAIPEFDAKRWKDQPRVVMETDKRYRIRGRFKRFSDTGFAYDMGLLEFVAVESVDARGKKTWVYPPGAWWHPLEVAQQKARDAAAKRRR